MGNVLKFPNSLWQANYTIQQRVEGCHPLLQPYKSISRLYFNQSNLVWRDIGTLKETTGSFKLCSYEKLGQRTKWQFLRGSRGQCSAHYWQISLAYQGLVFPHLPRVVNPTPKYSSLECVVNKWLSAANPPKHSAFITLLWAECQHHCKCHAVR